MQNARADTVSQRAKQYIYIYIYNSDCLQKLKEIPDNSVDLVVTDPPYEFHGGGLSGGGGAFGTKKRDYHAEYLKLYKDNPNISDYERQRRRLNACREQTDANIDQVSYGFDFAVLDELCRVMKAINIYVWCSKAQLPKLFNYFLNKDCFIDLITWHKTNPIPTCNGTYLNDTEYCVFARQKGVKVYGSYATKHKYYISKANVEDKKKYLHPTIKPLNIIENLIINSSLEGQTVLDPFMGVGTTGVACKKLGRNFIGIEIDPKWVEIGRKRINETE